MGFEITYQTVIFLYLLVCSFFLDLEKKEILDDYLDEPLPATELIKIMGDCILTFFHFLKIDKKKPSSFFWAHTAQGSLQQVQASLVKVCQAHG